MTDPALETHRPGGNPSDLQDKVGEADGRIVEEIEHDPDGDRRGHERQQKQQLGDALADKSAVQDEGDGHAENALDRHRKERERERPAKRMQKTRLGEHPRVAVRCRRKTAGMPEVRFQLVKLRNSV